MRRALPTVRLSTPAAALITFSATTWSMAASPDLCDEIQRRVHEQPAETIQGVYRQLGIRSKTVWIAPGWRPRLEVERTEARFPDINADYVILRISDHGAEKHQYLVFRQAAGRCDYVGKIDNVHNRYGPPKQRLEPASRGRVRLTLRVYSATGTGLAKEIDTWYYIFDRGVQEVLTYPAEGHESGAPPIFQSYATTVIPHQDPNGTEGVDIVFDAEYGGALVLGETLTHLFATQRKAHFVWRSSAKRFLLVASKSNASHDYIEWLYDEIEEGGFIKHHFRELLQLARTGDARQKRWLKGFLDQLAVTSPEITALRATFK